MLKKNFYCCNSFVLFFQVFDIYELSFKAGEVKLDTFFYEEGNIMWNGETGAKTGKNSSMYQILPKQWKISSIYKMMLKREKKIHIK